MFYVLRSTHSETREVAPTQYAIIIIIIIIIIIVVVVVVVVIFIFTGIAIVIISKVFLFLGLPPTAENPKKFVSTKY